MSDRRRGTPRRTARGGLPVQGALPPRRPVTPVVRRRGPFVLLALLVIALTAGLATRRLVDTGYFAVREPTVTGTALIAPDVVRGATQLQGKQLWQVDTEKVAALVRAIPAVKDAHIHRRWPNSVTIAVEERLPAALWRTGTADLVVDEEGVVLEAPVMGGMPAISAVDGPTGGGPGDRVDGDAVRLAITLASRLPAALGQRVARFEYSADGGLDVFTDRGQRVRFGDGQNLDYKLSLWRAITDQAKKDKLSTTEIDLRHGQWAALR